MLSSLYLEPVTMDKVHYCERFIELMIDLEVRSMQWLFYHVIIKEAKTMHMTIYEILLSPQTGLSLMYLFQGVS